MKTLDEVIKAFELCQEIACEKCPYSVNVAPHPYSHEDYRCSEGKDDDALHYLKEYKAHQADWSYAVANSKQFAEARDKHIKALAELKHNDPLSWDELREMEGKPVWVEGRTMDDKDGNYKFWCIVGKTDVLDTYIHLREHGHAHWKSTYGDWWQAYRKERAE